MLTKKLFVLLILSFGTKFTVGGSSAATHYDPFAAKSDGTAWISPQESIPSTFL